MIDKQRFRRLVVEAKGELDLTSFAEKTGLSKFTLSRFQAGSISNAPNESTLRKIADASDGRVSLYELLVSLGRYERANKLKSNDIADSPSKNDGDLYKKMKGVLDELMNDLAYVRKYESIDDFLDTFQMLTKEPGFYYRKQNEIELDKKMLLLNKFNGSAYCTPVTFMILDIETGITAYLVFALFYCKTTGTEASGEGVVILDKAFDLATMASIGAEDLYEMYKIAGETENARMKDFKLCYYEK